MTNYELSLRSLAIAYSNGMIVMYICSW